MKRPLVSVITCCYNGEKFIRDTIESVCRQTVQDFEYIFVDGGSTDSTVAIIQEYIERYPERFRLCHQSTKGLMRARNIGLSQAQGEYICFIDSDDLWVANKLEKQLDFYYANPKYGLIFSNYIDIDSDGREIDGSGRSHIPDLSIEGLFRHCYITNPSVMVKRTVYDKVGCFDETLYYSEDWDMWLRIATKYPIGYQSDTLVKYRIHGSNMSLGSIKHFNYQIAVMQKIADIEPKLKALLPKRLGSIYLVKGRKQLKMLDVAGARATFKSALKVYPPRAPVYLLGIILSYFGKKTLAKFVGK